MEAVAIVTMNERHSPNIRSSQGTDNLPSFHWRTTHLQSSRRLMTAENLINKHRYSGVKKCQHNRERVSPPSDNDEGVSRRHTNQPKNSPYLSMSKGRKKSMSEWTVALRIIFQNTFPLYLSAPWEIE